MSLVTMQLTFTCLTCMYMYKVYKRFTLQFYVLFYTWTAVIGFKIVCGIKSIFVSKRHKPLKHFQANETLLFQKSLPYTNGGFRRLLILIIQSIQTASHWIQCNMSQAIWPSVKYTFCTNFMYTSKWPQMNKSKWTSNAHFHVGLYMIQMNKQCWNNCERCPKCANLYSHIIN